jgi:hypothetical protein
MRLNSCENLWRQLGEAGRNNAAVACVGLGSQGTVTVSPMVGLVLPVEGLGKSVIEIVSRPKTLAIALG